MFETFTCMNKDVRLYCRRYGEGEPLILIHGACVDSDFFTEMAEHLSKHFRVYTYDRRGCGRSDDTEGQHSLELLAEDAACVLEHIGQSCHIVAHSAGTTIAARLALTYPEKIRSMILHEPVASDCLPEDSAQLSILREICSLIEGGKYHRELYKFLPLIGEGDSRARAATKEELNHFEKNTDCFIVKEFDTIFFSRLDYNALSKLGVPAYVGVGELSKGSGRWITAVNFAEKINARLVYFPGAHNCPYDLPKEFAWLVAGAILG